ncbi:MAG: efflux RND transporter periplasmic adaptor subunit [Armatimonadota bacterium]
MKKRLIIIVPILILGGLISWRLAESKLEASAQAKARESRSKAPVSVELAAAQTRDIINTFETTGSVEPTQSVQISPKVTGRIEYLRVREGMRVTAGQVLVRIDQSQKQAEVRQHKAALAESKYRLAQAKLTQSTTNTSVSTQVQQQEASVASARAELRQAEVTREAQIEFTKASLEDAQSKVDAANANVANINANIKSAQANLENAIAKHNRTLGLFKQGYVSAQDVDNTRTAVSVQQSLLDAARGQLQSAAASVNSALAQKRSVGQQASITRAKAEADIEAARARLAQAKASLEYAKSNIQQMPAYKQNLEALNASVSIAQASLESSQAGLADTVLRSPLDGVITARNQDEGSMALPGQPILKVQAIGKVWVTFSVPEDVYVKMRLNMPATVAFDALGGRKFTARVAEMNPSANWQSRQYTVRVILDNSHKLFTPGMFGRVTVVTEKAPQALAVPREAVQQDERRGTYVIAVGKNNTAEYRPIATGISDAGWIAVKAGLEPNARVVTMSASRVREGQQLGTGGRGGKKRT